MAVGIYTRLSLDKNDTGLAVQRQEEACRTLATSRGWDVAAVYTDNDVSASSGKPRPSYTRLLADLESGVIDGVVIYAWDRLARRMTDLVSFIDLQKRVGFEVAQVTGDVDLSTAAGRTTAHILGSVAQGEAERLGERVAAQKLQRAQLGIPSKGRFRLYGYDENWTPIPAEAAVIKEAFERRAKGESTTSICTDFTNRSIKTVSGRNWTSGVLGKTLTKHVYCGKIAYKGQVVSDSVYPAIVDEVTFNAAQANLANDSKGTNTRKYLLSGILLCRHCLSPMKGNPSNQMYRCSVTYGGCGRLSVRIELADKWIAWAALNKSHETPTKSEPVRDYESEIAALKATITKTQEAFEADVYTLSEAQKKIGDARDQLKKVSAAQAKEQPRFKYATATYLNFKRMNLSQKRALISTYIANVVVGPAISRGNQPFNPGRFEAHYTDGTVETLAVEIEPEQE